MNRFLSSVFFTLAVIILLVGLLNLPDFVESQFKIIIPFVSWMVSSKDESRLIFQLIDYVLNFIVLAAVPLAISKIIQNQLEIMGMLEDLEDLIRNPNKKPLTRRERFNRDVLGK